MGELGLSGVTVQLVNPSTNTVVATTTTSPSGVYLFQNVTAGPYIVRETTPAGFTPTTPTNVPVFAPSGGVAIADFGNQQTGRVAGTVFNDVNGDGVQNVIEVGVSGVTVQLVNPTTNTVVATTTTGANGDYAFTGVAAGPYIVRETTPAGFTPTTPTNLAVSVPAGGSANADFGVQQTGRINGVVYYDHNMNGVQDGPESGLGGVVVSLYAPGPDNVLGSADDVLLATTTTVAGGGYSFSPVSPGSYLVRQTVPLGYVPTTPVNVPVVVPAGGAGQANFGDVQTGLVNGTVFYDWNGSTVQDPGEAGVSGVTVRLYSPGPDGFLGTVDDVLVATTTTASNGTYSFTAVTPGSYLVRELTPAGFTTTTPSAKPVVVPPNGVGVADFGLLQVGALSGTVFNDLNGNGVQEPSEPGIGGVTVDLLNPNTLAVIGTTTTAGDGRYGFNGLTPGSYLVRETDPAGFSSTTPNQVAAFVPVNGAATVDFGDRAIGTISGVSFYDWNANGVQDPGETGIGGVTIQLVDPNTSTILATTTTAVSDGSYLFTNLAAGSYQVRETDPLGFTSTTPNQVNVTLPVGGSASADFGNRATSSVAGVVFNDVDGSGLQEFTEVGLSGVTVTLVSPGPDNLFGTGDDVTVATATTLPDGRYQFLGITPGTYQVRETDPAGFVSTTPNTVTVTAPLGGIGTANFGDQLRLQPTAVQVTAFTATATGSDVTVRWTTGNEVGLLGFQVWRSAQRDGDYRQVAPALLPAQAASGGATYKVVERGLSAGIWYYRVTLIGLDGQPMGTIGPLRVKVAETPPPPFLPLLSR
ncbi:MAG: hypothetical protein KIT87_05720 [Anaerolineae bacterium]|nr:hypothetical protein [Anaerolineae bacterium]